MKMIKRILAATLTLSALLSATLSVGAASAPSFRDVTPDAWYAEAVSVCSEAGILKGRGNDQFAPDAPLTLAELAVAMDRLYNYIVNGTVEVPSDINPEYLVFPETAENWWYVTSAHILMLRGFPPEQYAPDGYDKLASRHVLVELMGEFFPADTFAEASNAEVLIPDVAPDDPCYEYLQTLYQAGIINGKGNGYFCPADSLTRAELAAVVTRVIAAVKPPAE